MLLRSVTGTWAEAATANLVVGTRDGHVWTPDDHAGALPGTTRAVLLDAAEIAPRPLHPDMLPDVAWAVLTNAVSLLRPVAAIDDRPLSPPPEDWLTRAHRLLHTD